MATVLCTWLGLLLAASAGSKGWRVEPSARALATYGVSSPRLQGALVRALIAVEAALAVAMLAQVRLAATVAAALFGLFALATTAALLAGRGGRPCACFGSASRLTWTSPPLTLLPAALAAPVASGWLASAPSGYERWLTAGLAASVAAIVALGVALLAIAREVGVLRLSAVGPGALEIEQEGPALGSPQEWARAIAPGPRAHTKLAIFTSEACPLCRSVEPAVRHAAGDPLVAVAIFDEVDDAGVWSEAAVPGSPYAVALDLDGVALAKGTFNGLAQLESVVATARERERGASVAV